MYDRTGNYLIVAILIGMILGVVVVALFGEAAVHVKFLGDIFLNALKMIVIPLLFCSMVVGITNLGDIRKLGRTGLKTLLYFLITSAIAVVIGLILVNIFKPGVGFSISGAAGPEQVSYSFLDWLADQVPSNIVAAAAETKVLPIIVFALLFGGVLTTIGGKGKPVIAIIDGLNDAIMKIVRIVMWFAPIGIFGLVAGQLATQGGIGQFTNVLAALGKYSLVVILGLLIHGVIVLPLILKFVAGKNPVEYVVGMGQALVTAFATASSSATLPVTMECVEEKNDIDTRAASFVLPIGATINMDGTALYEAVAAMFIAQAYGIHLSILAQVVIFATAVLASIGAAGIPQAGLVTMVLVLQAVGLPLEGIGLILAIDWFLDRLRTTVNVWGDSVGAAVIASTSEIGLVDRRQRKPMRAVPDPRYKGARQRDDFHGRRRSGDVSGKPAETSGAAAVGKPGGVFEKVMRRNDKRGDRRRDQRDQTPDSRNRPRDQQPEPFRKTDARTEYRPAETSGPGNGRQQDKQRVGPRPGSRQQFGRKQHKGRYARPDRDSDRGPAANQPPDRPKTADDMQQRPIKPAYEVPKFPARILEELTTAPKEQELYLPESTESKSESDTGKEFDSTPDFSDQTLSDETARDRGSRPTDGRDFSRLDEIVMGGQATGSGIEETEDEEPESDTGADSWSDDSESLLPKSISDLALRPAAPPDETDFSDISGNDRSGGNSDVMQSKEETSGDDGIGREFADVNRNESEEEAEVSESDRDENETGSSADASDKEDDGDKEDSPKWGRSKHRRISR